MDSLQLDSTESSTEYKHFRLAGAERVGDAVRAELALVAGGMASFEWDMLGEVVHCGPLLAKYFGLPQGRETYGIDELFAVIHPDDVGAIDVAVNRSINEDVDYDMEWRVIHPNGDIRWLGGRGRIIERDAENNAIRMLGVNWDITSQKEQEQALTTMALEMQHRVKNAFAMVSALTSMAARRCQSPDEMMALLRGQIIALGKAHSLGLAGSPGVNGGIVRIADLIRIALEPWQVLSPDLELDTQASVTAQHAASLAMMLYELTTNATKYGGLSSERARLNISLQTLSDGEVKMSWRETIPPHAPRLQPDSSKPRGYGSILLAQAAQVLGAKFTHELHPDGLYLTLTIPQAALRAAEGYAASGA